MVAGGSIGQLFIKIGLQSTIKKDAKQAEGEVGKFKGAIQSHGLAIGAAFTAAGAALTILTDSAKKMNAVLGTTAMQLGISEEAMRLLVLETTNVTFPIAEVTASFDLLTRAGMTNEKQIQAVAREFDRLGDAVGSTASVVTENMIMAAKTFGLSMEDVAASNDKMTYMFRNTTLSMDNFASILGKTTPEVVAMGLTLDDTIALMGLMEGAGMTGIVATRAWQSALTLAEKEGISMAEALGFTNDQLEEYKEQMEDSEGMTKQYADSLNEQYGMVDKLKQAISELTLKYGTLLEPLDALGPSMTALGPIIIMLSAGNWALATSIKGATSAIIAQTAALLASPFGWVIIAVAGIIAVLIILEKKFGFISKAASVTGEALKKLIGWLKDKLAPATNLASAAYKRFGDKLLWLLGPIGLVAYGIKRLVNWYQKTRTTVDDTTKAIEDFGDAMEDKGKEEADSNKEMEQAVDLLYDLESAFRASKAAAGEDVTTMKDFKDAIAETYPKIAAYESLLVRAEDATQDLADVQKKVGDAGAEVDKLTSAYDDLKRAMGILEDSEENIEDQQRAVEHAEWGVKDAQDAYNEAVEEYGASSEEAARADLSLRDAEDTLGDAKARLTEIEAEVEEARVERSAIEEEYNVKDLDNLKELLDDKRSEYDSYVEDEIAARELLANTRTQIANQESTAEIQAWMTMKAEIENNPINRRIITTYIEQRGSEVESKQTGGRISEEGLYYLHPGEVYTPEQLKRLEPMAAGGGGAVAATTTAIPPVVQRFEFSVYNYSDIENLERMIAEATARGIHDKYGMR